jgi:hypothetical protein
MINYEVHVDVFHWDTDHYMTETLVKKFCDKEKAVSFKNLLLTYTTDDEQYPDGPCVTLSGSDDGLNHRLADRLDIWSGGYWPSTVKLYKIRRSLIDG